MGIHDQLMVLKWVQKNIEKFGGDAGKVTIFGEDAGAASVTILAMSPLASGLFHGAITLSGNALCDQYMQNDPNEAAVELANRLECSSEKGEDIVNCLSRQTQQDIIKASNSMAVSDLSFNSLADVILEWSLINIKALFLYFIFSDVLLISPLVCF